MFQKVFIYISGFLLLVFTSSLYAQNCEVKQTPVISLIKDKPLTIESLPDKKVEGLEVIVKQIDNNETLYSIKFIEKRGLFNSKIVKLGDINLLSFETLRMSSNAIVNIGAKEVLLSGSKQEAILKRNGKQLTPISGKADFIKIE
jgi:hypothetical protein